MDLRSSLDACGLTHAAEALAALGNGWLASSSAHNVSLSELEFVYSRRLQHLQSLPGEYAADLAASTKELLASIHQVSPATAHWLTIKGAAEHYFIVLISGTDQILGCLRIVSNSEPSSAE